MTAIVYFGMKWALEKHDDVLKVSGGLAGVRRPELLKSVLTFMKNDDYYDGFCAKLTHLVFSVAKNHVFVDGNKRTAIALGAYFLVINGYDERVARFFIEMENIILWIAVDVLSKENFEVIMHDFVESGEFSESSQLILLSSSTAYEEYIEEIHATRGADGIRG